MPEINAQEWESFLDGFSESHILQSMRWGDLKAKFGWDVVRVISASALSSHGLKIGAQILFRPLPLGYSIAYIPKGPVSNAEPLEVGSTWQALLPVIDPICRQRRAVFLKVEPDNFEPVQVDGKLKRMPESSTPSGFRMSEHSIQPPRTIVVNISGDEEAILGRMKQKTRYNIRLAQKKGIVVSASTDLTTFNNLMRSTGQRDRFQVHSPAYYQAVYEVFHPVGQCEIFQAEYEGQPLASLMIFTRGKRAWYFYGASIDHHRELMPSYLLQWEAIRWARLRGCESYDLWGVPDYDLDDLERLFSVRSGGLWGVYRFKRGFGGQLRRASGPWDRVYQPIMYNLYRTWIRLRDSQSEYTG